MKKLEVGDRISFTKKLKFGDRIDFDERFVDIVYINNKNYYDIKLYTDVDYDNLNIVKTTEMKKDGLLHEKEKTIYPASYRKLIFEKNNGSGIIIGQTIKKEGYYSPTCRPSAPYYDDYEPASLDVKKTYTFWIVATKMNEKVLVPKTAIKP